MPAAPEPMLVLRGSGDMDTRLTVSQPGLLPEDVQLLDHVRTEDVLGRVIDPSDGSEREIVRAPHDGVVGIARRMARVEPGDGVYTLTSVWAATR